MGGAAAAVSGTNSTTNQQVHQLQSSSRSQKKTTSNSFLKQQTIGGTGTSTTVAQQPFPSQKQNYNASASPQKTSNYSLGKRINMISGSGTTNKITTSGTTMGQSKSQPGLVKIPRTQVVAANNASMHGSAVANNQSNQSNSRQAVESNN